MSEKDDQKAFNRFKTHNTPEKLSILNNVSLEQLGVSDKEHRKQTLTAIKKVGWVPDLPSKSFISPPVRQNLSRKYVSMLCATCLIIPPLYH